MNLFQSDFISIGKTENHFWAAPSSVVWIKAVRLCIQYVSNFDVEACLLIQVLYLKLNLL